MEKKRREADFNFILAHNTRSGTYQAFKSQNVEKIYKTIDLIGFSHSFFQRWNIHQLYGYMTL